MSLLRNVMIGFVMTMLASTASAVEFYDIQFPDKLKLPGTHSEIQLNGIGYRTKFFFKIYIGALYTLEKSSSPDIIKEQPGAKRIQMNFLYDEVSKEKLIKAWNEGFESNNDEATLAKLAERIKQFNNYFPTLKAGDVVLLDYIPRTGTHVSIRGTEVGVIKGKDFYDALLDIWLGDEPADEDLKEAMLGID